MEIGTAAAISEKQRRAQEEWVKRHASEGKQAKRNSGTASTSGPGRNKNKEGDDDKRGRRSKSPPRKNGDKHEKMNAIDDRL